MRNRRYISKKNFLGILLIALAFIVGLIQLISDGVSESYATGYVMCHPGSYVNARIDPSTKSESIGILDTGHELYLDGETENGFAHCVNTSLEVDELWVYTGYIVFDEPEWMNGRTATVVSNGRLAARESMTGKVLHWLKNGTEIQVFWYSEEWCVTNRGFVMTEYIELDGE